MNEVERYITALRVVQHNLIGKGFDALKPMSAQSCSNLAEYIEHIINGATPQEAADRMAHANPR